VYGPLPFLIFVAVMILAWTAGCLLQSRVRRTAVGHRLSPTEAGQQGYLVTTVFGLLALLATFTMALSLDRYETRRQLVITEANAIGTAYLRAQLMPEPHRSRISGLLVAYTDNRIELATTTDPAVIRARGATDQRLLDQIWAAVAASVDEIQLRGFANAYLQSFNDVIDLDTERTVARLTRVPDEVLWVLSFYMAAAAGLLGYVLEGRRGRVSGVIMIALLSASMLLILDINQPTAGGIRESQEPMRALSKTFHARSPQVFDMYKAPRPPGPG
jgi:hypothetical protein